MSNLIHNLIVLFGVHARSMSQRQYFTIFPIQGFCLSGTINRKIKNTTLSEQFQNVIEKS
jgi:hypothetical protein